MNLNNEPKIQEIQISYDLTNTEHYSPLRIGVISDIHLRNRDADLKSFKQYFGQLQDANPDFIFFLGDYIDSSVAKNYGLEEYIDIREAFLEFITRYDTKNFYFVLGNHDNWNGRTLWQESLAIHNLRLMDDFQLTLESKFCLIGLSDGFSLSSDFIPEGCGNNMPIYITHDPVKLKGIVKKGLGLAGHTHCGQIALPIVGALWAPTDAPRNQWCGLSKNNDFLMFTSAGLGNSILDLRFFTQPRIELLNIVGESDRYL